MVAGSIHFAELYRSIGMVFDDQRGQGRVLRIETQEVWFNFQINENIGRYKQGNGLMGRIIGTNHDTLSQLASPIA